MNNPNIDHITQEDIDKALSLLEYYDKDSANAIRHYIQILLHRLLVYELGDDDYNGDGLA